MLVHNLKKQLDRTIENDQLLPDEEYVIEKDVGKVVNQTSVTQAGGGNSFVLNKETTSFNDVIDKEKYLNPVETYPTNIARSDLNVLKRKTILQTVVLNTSFRQNYMNTSSTNFSMVLPYQFKNVMSMRLSSIQLPNVLYCFSTSKKNNTIYFHVIHEIPTPNKTGSQPYQKESIDDEFYRTGSSSNWNQSLWVEGGSPASTGAVCRIAGNVISGNGGINVLSPNKTVPSPIKVVTGLIPFL